MLSSPFKNIILIISYLICNAALANTDCGNVFFHVENESGAYDGSNKKYDKVILSCDSGYRLEVKPCSLSFISSEGALGTENKTRQCQLTAEENQKIIPLATFSISCDVNTGNLQHSPITYNQTQVCSHPTQVGCRHSKPESRIFYLATSHYYYENGNAACVCDYQN